MIKKYDERKTKTPRDIEIIVGYCEHCGGEIYLGVPHYNTREGKVEEDCFEYFAKDCLEAELIEGLI